jgi:hypothetical protein
VQHTTGCLLLEEGESEHVYSQPQIFVIEHCDPQKISFGLCLHQFEINVSFLLQGEHCWLWNFSLQLEEVDIGELRDEKFLLL